MKMSAPIMSLFLALICSPGFAEVSFDELDVIYNSASPLEISDLSPDEVWSGIGYLNNRGSVKVKLPVIMSNGNMFAALIRDQNHDDAWYLRQLRNNLVPLTPLVPDLDDQALRYGVLPSHWEVAQHFFLRKTTAADGSIAIIEKSVCADSRGCLAQGRVYRYGEIGSYSYYTNRVRPDSDGVELHRTTSRNLSTLFRVP